MYTKLLKGNFITIFALIRTRCLLEIGGFDENLFTIEDYDAWLRLSKKYTFASVNANLAIAYNHGGSHVNENISNKFEAKHIIAYKHKDSLETLALESDEQSRWRYMQLIITSCIYCRDYKGFMRAFCRQIYLSPLKTPLSIYGIIRFLSGWLLRVKLCRKFPSLCYALRKIKHKMKGEHVS